MTTIPADVALGSSQADSAAVEAVHEHHAALAGRLDHLVEAVVTAPDADASAAATRRLHEFCTGELLPHALGEEESIYAVGTRYEQARLLVEAMIAEHRAIQSLVHTLGSAPDPARATATAGALATLFAVHRAKEDDLLVPLVAADPGVSLADVVDELHHAQDAHRPTPAAVPAQEESHGCGSGHACGCGESDEGVPELDVRNVPHAIRHATVFGAFDAVRPGASLVLVAPHNPLPLLHQLSERAGGGLEVRYLDEGPEAWRLLLTRV